MLRRAGATEHDEGHLGAVDETQRVVQASNDLFFFHRDEGVRGGGGVCHTRKADCRDNTCARKLAHAAVNNPCSIIAHPQKPEVHSGLSIVGAERLS